MFRRLAATAMFASLSAATVLSFVWVLVAAKTDLLESSAQALGLVAALTAIMAERVAAERQSRRQALAVLADELRKNQDVLGDLRFTLGRPARRRVYPRLLISAADGVITSGVLTTAGDRELTAKLHRWRNEVTDFNRRLDLTEMMTFLQGTPEVIRGFEQALGSDNDRLQRIDQQLQDLLDALAGPVRRPVHHPPGPPIPVPAPRVVDRERAGA
jgi:hypothetical protein